MFRDGATNLAPIPLKLQRAKKKNAADHGVKLADGKCSNSHEKGDCRRYDKAQWCRFKGDGAEDKEWLFPVDEEWDNGNAVHFIHDFKKKDGDACVQIKGKPVRIEKHKEWLAEHVKEKWGDDVKDGPCPHQEDGGWPKKVYTVKDKKWGIPEGVHVTIWA